MKWSIVTLETNNFKVIIHGLNHQLVETTIMTTQPDDKTEIVSHLLVLIKEIATNTPMYSDTQACNVQKHMVEMLVTLIHNHIPVDRVPTTMRFYLESMIDELFKQQSYNQLQSITDIYIQDGEKLHELTTSTFDDIKNAVIFINENVADSL